MLVNKIKNKGDFTQTLSLINHENSLVENRKRLPVHTKKKNKTQWVEIKPQSMLHAQFYALNAGISHWLIPNNTGKVRIVQAKDNNKNPLLFTKYQEDYLALGNSSFYGSKLNLPDLQNKFLSDESIRSAAAVMVEWYVLQEADANLGNIGFTDSKKNVYRLDYDYTLFDFIAQELKIPDEANPRFPITESDLKNFPNCENIIPKNYMNLSRENNEHVKFLENLNNNADFMKYADLYFLKSLLMEPNDIRIIFDMHVKEGETALRRRYVNYLDQRVKNLKTKLFNLQRFRDNFRQNFDEYKQIILEEFEYYYAELKNKAEYKDYLETKLDRLLNQYLPLCEQLSILEAQITNHKELFKLCRILLELGEIQETAHFIQIINSLSETDDVLTLLKSVKAVIFENLKLKLDGQIDLLKNDQFNPYKLAIVDLIQAALDRADLIAVNDLDSAIELLKHTMFYSEDLQSLLENGQISDTAFTAALTEYKNATVTDFVDKIINFDYKTKALVKHQERLRALANNGYAQELADFVEHISDYLNSRGGKELPPETSSNIFESTNQLCFEIHSMIQNSTITNETFELKIKDFFENHQDLLENLFQYSDKRVRELMYQLYDKNIEKLSIFSIQMAHACMYAQELSYKNEKLVASSFLIKIKNILKLAYHHENYDDFETLSQNIANEINKPTIILHAHRGVYRYLDALLRFIRTLFSSSNTKTTVHKQYGIATKRVEKLTSVVDSINNQIDIKSHQ